jgi:hypothetical protein
MEKQKGLLQSGKAAYTSPAMEMIEMDAETSFALSSKANNVEDSSVGGDYKTSLTPSGNDIQDISELLNW